MTHLNNSPTTGQSGFTLPKNSPPAFHILAKPTGAICNLDCKYCFSIQGNAAIPAAASAWQTSFRRLISNSCSKAVNSGSHHRLARRQADFDGLRVFEKSVQYAEKPKRSHQHVEYTVQTNGAKLDDELCTFFKKNNFLVGLSVDGPRKIHDTYRVNKRGDGSSTR